MVTTDTLRLRIRSALEGDVPFILGCIRQLAEYERLEHEVTATEADLLASLFGPVPAAEVAIAFSDETPVGFAVFFTTFSTFVGRPGLHLEDLFVRPEWRGRGIGRRLMAHLASLAVERNYGRMEWSVLDWNDLALGMYRRLGAKPMDEWTVYRLTDEALRSLAASPR